MPQSKSGWLKSFSQPLFLIYCNLCSEVVVQDILWRYSETVKQLDYRSNHHRRSAHEIEGILRILMLLEVSLIHYIVHKACNIWNPCLICSRIRPVKRKVELEVRELLLNLVVILKVERFLETACSVEEVDFP